MPYPTILTQAQVQPHIVNLLLNTNAAVLQARSLGLTGFWMPEEIKFDFLLIDQFQILSVQTQEGGTNTEAQTGTDTSVQTGTEAMVQTGTDAATTAATTTDTTTQTTTHGETVNTTDLGETLYVSGDLQTGLQVSGDPYLDPPITLPF